MASPEDGQTAEDKLYEYLTGGTLDAKISSLLIEGEHLAGTFAANEGKTFAVTTERIVIYKEYSNAATVHSVPLNALLELVLQVRALEECADGETKASLEIVVHGIQISSSWASSKETTKQRTIRFEFEDPAEARRAHDLILRGLSRRSKTE